MDILLTLIHLAGGSAVFLLSLHMLRVASPRKGKRPPFMESEIISSLYLYAILFLFFGGAIWVTWGAINAIFDRAGP